MAPKKPVPFLCWEALLVTDPVIQGLIDQGLIRACQSACNTPILSIKKPNEAVNEATKDIHPLVPNPYTLWVTLPSTRIWYSVLNIKYAFFLQT